MKIPNQEPFVAIFFKAAAILTILIGVYMMATGGGLGLAGGLYLILGAAPVSWWMGAILAYLARIACASEARLEARPEPRLESRSSSLGKVATAPAKTIFAAVKAGDDLPAGDVPSYKL